MLVRYRITGGRTKGVLATGMSGVTFDKKSECWRNQPYKDLGPKPVKAKRASSANTWMRDEISVAGIYSTREDMLKAEVEKWTGADSHKML